jgi:transposase-like protein
MLVGGYEGRMTTPSCIPSYAGYRFPAEVISYVVYLYFRFPLSHRRSARIFGDVPVDVANQR